MAQHKGLTAPQNTFLNTIVARADGAYDAFVLGNAQPQHYPIVYCSDGFLVLTRYPRASVMSRSSVCHFLWGPKTSAKDRARILKAFRRRAELFLELVFYKRTGEPFLCDLNINPIKNEKGCVVLFLCNFIGVSSSRGRKRPSINTALSYGQLNHLHLREPPIAQSRPGSRSSLPNNAIAMEEPGTGSKCDSSKAMIRYRTRKSDDYLRRSYTDLTKLIHQNHLSGQGESQDTSELEQNKYADEHSVLPNHRVMLANSVRSSSSDRTANIEPDYSGLSYSFTANQSSELNALGGEPGVYSMPARMRLRLDPSTREKYPVSSETVPVPAGSLDLNEPFNVTQGKLPVPEYSNVKISQLSSASSASNLPDKPYSPQSSQSLLRQNTVGSHQLITGIGEAIGLRAHEKHDVMSGKQHAASRFQHQPWSFNGTFDCTGGSVRYDDDMHEVQTDFSNERPLFNGNGHKTHSGKGLSIDLVCEPETEDLQNMGKCCPISVNHIVRNIPDVHHDPDAVFSFESWYKCYEDIFTGEHGSYDEAPRICLLLCQLDPTEHNRYSNYILPAEPRTLKFPDTSKPLKKIIGQTVPLFNIRSSGIDVEASPNIQSYKSCGVVRSPPRGNVESFPVQNKGSTMIRFLSGLLQAFRLLSSNRATGLTKERRRTSTGRCHFTKSPGQRVTESNDNTTMKSMCTRSPGRMGKHQSSRNFTLGSVTASSVCEPPYSPASSSPSTSSSNSSTSSSLSTKTSSDVDEPDPSNYSFKRRKSFAILHNIPLRKQKKRNTEKLNQVIAYI
ncbi:unnamed protein product [Echinostoma caproni]|uniref:PAS domain-containing protein n=1 Tax=Echinostoma caproni TaxID=27848 RepID=A0A183A529_9TREM|nr:unnamed protein product [Echinostoma caproni]